MNAFYLNIWGITVKVSTNNDFVFQNLTRDFALLIDVKPSGGSSAISIEIRRQEPDYSPVPPLDSAWYALGFICYKDKDINYVVYSSDHLLIYDFKKEAGELSGKDEFFLYEKTRLMILSRSAELLERKGLHRIHAFGVSLNDKTLICMLPMEGGKTTSILNLLRHDPEVKILADDICFVDAKGGIRPFLLRIGARDAGLIDHIPASFVSRIDRPYYGVKYFIDPGFFNERLGKEETVTHLMVGQRSFRPETSIDPLSKLRCIGPMFESGVFGRGLPDLLEFFVRGQAGSVWGRIMILLSRSWCFCLLVIRCKTLKIKIGHDQKKTYQEILSFLHSDPP